MNLTTEQRAELERWVRRGSTPRKQAQRAEMILLTADHVPSSEIVRRLRTSYPTLSRWRQRFIECGVDGLRKGKTRRPGIAPLPQAKIDEILTLTATGRPANATHWSARKMAAQVGVSEAKVRRIWKAAQLAPHRVRRFKISNDPRFAEKLVDVVGLYLDPPEKALVLCVDEKSQIQALDRTQPGLPLKRGEAQTLTHDYKRHGTTTLFAALNVISGEVIGTCLPQHRHDEFLRFLKHLDRRTPKALDLHLIIDNYATHKHPNVNAWLAQHPRFHLHFTPTSASWLNLVERFFRNLTEDQIRRGVFRSVADLERAIMAYLDHRNEHPKPYRWTATAASILAKVHRANVSLDAVQ
ncbi:MAG: IS630 family transposase [Candidatus Macondimonas sp.]